MLAAVGRGWSVRGFSTIGLLMGGVVAASRLVLAVDPPREPVKANAPAASTGFSSSTLAGEKSILTTNPAAFLGPAVSVGSEKLLVLQDGRVLEGGRVRPVPGGYSVEKGTGTIMIPSDQVQCAATDLKDAYRKLRDNHGLFNPDSRMLLAQWCVTHRLYHEATDQLRSALKQDPERADVRKMLLRVEEMLDPESIAKPKKVGTAKIPENLATPDVESLGGLSRETAATFTSKVQPLLMNKCGNGNCHGAGNTSDFKLAPVRAGTGSHRLYSERNLAEVLRYLDPRDPGNSPLLAKTQGTHGGQPGSIFAGSQGSEQVRVIRQWLTDAAKDKYGGLEFVKGDGPTFKPVPSSKKPGNGKLDMAADSELAVTEMNPGDVSKSNVLKLQGPLSTPTEHDGTVTTAVYAEDAPFPASVKKPDPFDPQQFNKRFHAEERLNRSLRTSP